LEGNWKKKVEEIGKKLEDYWRKLVYCVEGFRQLFRVPPTHPASAKEYHEEE